MTSRPLNKATALEYLLNIDKNILIKNEQHAIDYLIESHSRQREILQLITQFRNSMPKWKVKIGIWLGFL